ncbi:MerR family transcriptional regulator [Streptomyces calidiresistens]|uniref:MerR family transcriptional regulator n=1 Tax=Streptomyces calidiresistens TaxID=1485586 RepID=A0A7W3T0C5_9ACTN|nr:MerR family transcriptional regulator [Streptomyces calidiresistens]
MTIGAFARLTRLSPKALRLYDDLGLLPPARVDPTNGYRYYSPDQVERARLVAWLRRLGMPLALIRRVCALDGPAAAGEVRAFMARAEADLAARRDLAGFLVDHLSRRESAVTSTPSTPSNSSHPPTPRPLEVRAAALTDPGLVRDRHQDAACADPRVIAVADGFGPRGDSASAAAIEALRHAGAEGIRDGDLLNVLQDAVDRARAAVREAASGSAPRAIGTTLTAMLWSDTGPALMHIGDSRAHLLRDGDLRLITRDHTVVRTMVEEGRITPEEAESHPQRSLLVRVLADGADPTPDLRLHEARAGDRYLLCSDGLSTVVPEAELCRVLSEVPEPEDAVRELVGLANAAGGPDNIACVVADVRKPRVRAA